MGVGVCALVTVVTVMVKLSQRNHAVKVRNLWLIHVDTLICDLGISYIHTTYSGLSADWTVDYSPLSFKCWQASLSLSRVNQLADKT